LLPLAPGALLLARREVARDRAAGTIEVELAGLPRARGEAVAAELARLAIVPARVALAGADGEPVHDFLPALRGAGLVAPASRAPAIAWAVVGFLFLLNLGVLVWRDEARVEAFDALVAAQRPAVGLTQRLQRRIARFDGLAAAASARRASEPLARLGAVGTALPPGAFLQRFELDGDTLRLAGYKPAGANLVAALRQNPRFADVRALRSDGVAELPGAQPFDISARVVR
ncbi:hypothetical protein IP88_03160, partial [alpha proteobacterium AAP81b]